MHGDTPIEEENKDKHEIYSSEPERNKSYTKPSIVRIEYKTRFNKSKTVSVFLHSII